MTRYIKGKDGKFAGSIGSGKSKTPTSAPMHPPVQVAAEPTEPMEFPRAKNFADLVSRHANAYSQLALSGITPRDAARYSRYDSGSLSVLVPAHKHHLLDTPLLNPTELQEVYASLGDIDHRQKMVLLDLEYLADSCEQFAEFRQEECDECGMEAFTNTPELYNGEYCARHRFIGNITNLYDISDLIEDAKDAVEDDYSVGDREANIVMTSLLPDPYKVSDTSGN